jgi:hypothetical protein
LPDPIVPIVVSTGGSNPGFAPIRVFTTCIVNPDLDRVQ